LSDRRAGSGGFVGRQSPISPAMGTEALIAGSKRLMMGPPRGVAAMGNHMAKNPTNEKTGKKAGTAASKVLKSPGASKDAKTAAGSALSQRPNKK